MSGAVASRNRLLAAMIVLIAVAAVAIAAFWPRPGTPTTATDHTTHSSATPTLSPVDATDDAVEGSVGTAPESSLADAAATPPGATRDNSALGQPRPPVDPGSVLDGAFGGCTAEYGATGQCLPVYPPSLSSHVQEMLDAGLDPSTMPHNWTCDEVRQYFPSGIAVRQPGIDPQALDDDGDAMACEPVTEED